MRINPSQMQAVLELPGPQRYAHFVKVIADWQEVWGLYSGGWALAATDDGTSVFPLWPAKEYALVCADNEWAGYEPRPISLIEFTDVLLPKLKNDGVLPGVFFTPTSKGVTPSVDELQASLKLEMENY